MSRVLVTCRCGVGDLDILPYWVEHYGGVGDLLVSYFIEDADNLAEEPSSTGEFRIHHHVGRYTHEGTVAAWKGDVLAYCAGRPEVGWVVSVDVDEFLSGYLGWGYGDRGWWSAGLEEDEEPGLVEGLGGVLGVLEKLERSGGGRRGYVGGWMVDRFSPGGVEVPLGGGGGHSVGNEPVLVQLGRRFPLRSRYTSGRLGALDFKVVVTRPEDACSVHDAPARGVAPPWHLCLEHFKWRAWTAGRLEKRLGDREADVGGGSRWVGETRRALEDVGSPGLPHGVFSNLVQSGGWVHGWNGDYMGLYKRAAEHVPEGGVAVEVGVWQGRSLSWLATCMLALGKRFRIVGVDPFRSFPGSKTGYPDRLRPLVTGGGSWEPLVWENLYRLGLDGYVELDGRGSPAAADRFADASVDFVWVDGAHDAKSVEADCRAWWSKLKPGGVLAGHDFGQGGVKAGVEAAGLRGLPTFECHPNSFWVTKPV